MPAKVEVEDRYELATRRDKDAPLRRRWLRVLVPIPLKPLAASGVVAGAVALLAVVACGSSQEALNIEGVGEIEGPVAVYGKREPAESASEDRYSVFAIDLETGRGWDIWDTTAEVIGILPAGVRLAVWSPDSLAIHSVSLDGQSEVLLQSGGALAPRASFDGSKIAFAVDGSPSDEPDRIIVLDVQSGDEILRVEADDPRVDADAVGSDEQWALEVSRWSVDGSALLVWRTGGGSFILTLDGEVHEIPDERDIPPNLLSPDLRYGTEARRLFSAGAESLTVVELATGRDLLTLTAADGSRIWHAYGPASGKYLYATAPLGVGSDARRDLLVWHLADLDTGNTTVVSIGDEKLQAEWEWIWWLQEGGWLLSPMAQCLYRHRDLDLCADLIEVSQEALEFLYKDQERRERSDSIRRTDFIGFVWLD